jgi:hypothetical protein
MARAIGMAFGVLVMAYLLVADSRFDLDVWLLWLPIAALVVLYWGPFILLSRVSSRA